MKIRISQHREARVDLIAISLQIAVKLKKPTASHRFTENVNETLNTLIMMPYLGSGCKFKKTKYAKMRSCPVKDFPNILIFYTPIKDGIEVYRIVCSGPCLDAVFA